MTTAPDVFFGYDTASLEAMQVCKERGVHTVLDQIDPCEYEVDLVRAEQEAWPEWQDKVLQVPDEFYRRHREEWHLADSIVVNSGFSRQALIAQDVPPEKIHVVPLTYEDVAGVAQGTLENERSRDWSRNPLRVLFLGQVILRKGIHYLVQAAELLRREPVVFEIVGPIGISEKMRKLAPENVRFHGRAPRDGIGLWYARSHVFILPTLSDGFAITQLEAMAHGLPVIATPNCGEVVSHGVDGFLVEPRDPRAIVRAVQEYLNSPGILEEHAFAAKIKSARFSLDRVHNGLQRALRIAREEQND